MRSGVGCRDALGDDPSAPLSEVKLCSEPPLVWAGMRLPVAKAARLLASVRLNGAVVAVRVELTGELLEDLRCVDAQIIESRKWLAEVVKASRTSTTKLFGVRPDGGSGQRRSRRRPTPEDGANIEREAGNETT